MVALEQRVDGLQPSLQAESGEMVALGVTAVRKHGWEVAEEVAMVVGLSSRLRKRTTTAGEDGIAGAETTGEDGCAGTEGGWAAAFSAGRERGDGCAGGGRSGRTWMESCRGGSDGGWAVLVVEEEDDSGRGGAALEQRWQREIAAVEAGSIAQAAMLTAAEGEKGEQRRVTGGAEAAVAVAVAAVLLVLPTKVVNRCGMALAAGLC
ncbi:hypothetical protein BHE74_00043259 [Ensete ventricosum]|nr:hypothetical protein BHE74_00043259 [Ensete ventricosum]